MHIHPLRALDPVSERLLRTRAEHRDRDPDESVASIRAALAAGRIEAAALLDDDETAHGIAAWRWSDRERTYAQVLFLYTPRDADPDHSALLVDHIVTTLTATPDLRVIEARLRDEAPGIRPAWRNHDFVIFERCRVRRSLSHDTLLPIIPIPNGYHVVPWRTQHNAQAEAIATNAHRGGVEPVAVPNMMQHHLATLRSARTGPDWSAEASSIALDKQNQVVGYVAVTRSDETATILDLAVDPAHQDRGLAGALLIRTMRICLHQGIPAITAVFTMQNPIQLLFNRLSFHPVDCGQIAVWWYDKRQLEWLT
ncbi:MAG: GNAT family N-acetyltransferase [Anaerolineae bacterium]|nr:GNAT family N-acetyltransferase [Anaerolineae bacterium]